MALNVTKTFWTNPLLKPLRSALALERVISTTSVCNRTCVGRYKKLEGRNQLLTLEEAVKPHEIGHMKSWNSWNTSLLAGGKRSQITTVEDMFIRKFIAGAWFGLVIGNQIIIKRQHNIVRIAFVISDYANPQNAYFMTGFTEEMLSIWLHCPVKLEIQAIPESKAFVKVI